jgi:hypothetical protein
MPNAPGATHPGLMDDSVPVVYYTAVRLKIYRGYPGVEGKLAAELRRPGKAARIQFIMTSL